MLPCNCGYDAYLLQPLPVSADECNGGNVLLSHADYLELQASGPAPSFWSQLTADQTLELGWHLFAAVFVVFAVYKLFQPPTKEFHE